MVDNEFLRQRREREFQQRVLAAVEKPKTSRIFKIMNAPSFLWLLTALILTVGGAYISVATSNACATRALISKCIED
jgi:hypothetical protein